VLSAAFTASSSLLNFLSSPFFLVVEPRGIILLAASKDDV